ncbi:hypothetical protein CSA56_05050 [candidate division KSB3 bacterium]|uniref:Uncharacterized protein n=1 Tax=candidate division KSB3 bacterium TaxID=2044937 RepID=A0A2G6KHV6_9BACT|nr:MAG: hypothetical protein CSA56_05050 [candidate division KSB3 bacterium]
MYWTDLKRALLYGQPTVRPDHVQAHVLKTAIRDIIRLISCGWIDELPDGALQRIQTACQVTQCQEVWDEFQFENPLLKQRKKPRKSRQGSS